MPGPDQADLGVWGWDGGRGSGVAMVEGDPGYGEGKGVVVQWGQGGVAPGSLRPELRWLWPSLPLTECLHHLDDQPPHCLVLPQQEGSAGGADVVVKHLAH